MFPTRHSPRDQLLQLLHKFLLLLAFLLGDQFRKVLAVLLGHLLAHLLGNLEGRKTIPPSMHVTMATLSPVCTSCAALASIYSEVPESREDQ